MRAEGRGVFRRRREGRGGERRAGNGVTRGRERRNTGIGRKGRVCKRGEGGERL
jgi:hypothetical protein